MPPALCSYPSPTPPIRFDQFLSHYPALSRCSVESSLLMPFTYHFELFKGVFWFKVENLAVWKKATTQDAMFVWMMLFNNRPRSIYQYSNMAPRLSGQNCKFFKFLLSLNFQKRLEYKENNTKYRSLTQKPRSHVRILIYRTWPIGKFLLSQHY